jgi:hypothetical protein
VAYGEYTESLRDLISGLKMSSSVIYKNWPKKATPLGVATTHIDHLIPLIWGFRATPEKSSDILHKKWLRRNGGFFETMALLVNLGKKDILSGN